MWGRRIGRGLLLAGLLVLLLPAGATPAFAHAGGLVSSSSEARVLAVDPPIPGLSVQAVEFGARLRIDNGTRATVLVEPLPGSVLSGLPSVAPGGRAYWNDPRTIAAAAAPRPPGGRLEWSIPLRIGDADALVQGEQYWPPAPSPLWWAAAALALMVAALVGVVGARYRWGRTGLVAVTVVVLIAHLVHVLGSAGVPEDQPYPLMMLSAAGYALLGWPLGAIGAVLTLRGNAAGPLLCCAAGGLFAIVIAPVDAFALVDAVVPFSWGADLDRTLVAVTLGGGLGVVVAGMAVLRRGAVAA